MIAILDNGVLRHFNGRFITRVRAVCDEFGCKVLLPTHRRGEFFVGNNLTNEWTLYSRNGALTRRSGVPSMYYSALGHVLYNESGKSYDWSTASLSNRIAPVPKPHGSYWIGDFQNTLYKVGGYENENSTPTVYRLEGAQWKSCPSMLQARHCFGACVFKNKLYVIGGFCVIRDKPHNVERSIECFDGKEWKPCPDLPYKRTNIAAAALRGSIYIFGDEKPALKWVVKRNEWRQCPDVVFSIDCQAISV